MHIYGVRVEAVPRVDYVPNVSAKLGALRYLWKALKCNFTLIQVFSCCGGEALLSKEMHPLSRV